MAATVCALVALFLAQAAFSAAEPQATSPASAPSTEPGGPGALRLGPAYFTPSLRISSLGLDTNVFYTATDRRTDFIAHGGPGLEMVLPLRGAFRLRADGTLGYLYFARTKSQRRLT